MPRTISVPLNLVGAMHFELEDDEVLTLAVIEDRLQSIRSMLDTGDMQSSGDARLSVAVDRLEKNVAIESYDRETRKSTDTDWPTQ